MPDRTQTEPTQQFPAPVYHRHDEDCTVDPETSCCTECGVEHGDPCAACNQRAFHFRTCPLMEVDPADVAGAGADL